MGKNNDEEIVLDWKQNAVLYLKEFVNLLAIAMVLFLLCFRLIVVSGSSMCNTLVDGDYLLLINNTFYREPQRGDIIVASKESHENGAPIIKRIIATEGQIVDIDFSAGIVYVDGVALDEPYTATPTNIEEGMAFPLMVDDGCCFVMGDNRNGSKDSRHPEIGLIDTREILGKVFLLVLPGSGRNMSGPDYGRIGVIR